LGWLRFSKIAAQPEARAPFRGARCWIDDGAFDLASFFAAQRYRRRGHKNGPCWFGLFVDGHMGIHDLLRHGRPLEQLAGLLQMAMHRLTQYRRDFRLGSNIAQLKGTQPQRTRFIMRPHRGAKKKNR